jgi:ParB family chromosome partitioning protein
MVDMTRKKGLGRGLSALIDDRSSSAEALGPMEIKIDAVSPNPLQPRGRIDDEDLKALALSIQERGLIEPLVVRRKDQEAFELIAGERRWRAARMAGLSVVPAVVRQATQVEMLELALIENLHREDLNPLEEAESFQALMEKFDHTPEQIARLTGRDRSTISNTVRLLNLPGAVQDDVRARRLSAGHARALLALSDPKLILQAREEVLAKGLSVRQAESLVKQMLKNRKPPARSSGDEVYFQDLADQMTRAVGSKVRLVRKGKKSGKVEIAYSNYGELERIMARLGVGGD